jgi:hypothetical protein
MLKRWQTAALLAVGMAAIGFATSFFFPAVYYVCGPDDYTHIKECAPHHFGPAIVVWAMVQVDNHNGLATAMATVVIAAFTIILVRINNRQVEAQTAVSRAFVFVEEFETTFSNVWPTPSSRPDICNLMILPRWKNSGDTPTRNLTIRVNCRLVAADLPDTFDYSYDREPLKALIGPKANEWNEPFFIEDADASAAASGSGRHLYVWGRADYQDVFSVEKWRYTLFCYRIRFHQVDNEIKGQFTAYGPHNISDMDNPSGLKFSIVEKGKGEALEKCGSE